MSLRSMSAVAVLAASAWCAAPAAWAQDATVKQVYQAAEAGKFIEAQAMMDKVLRDHPNSGKAHFIEAELLAKQGKFTAGRGRAGDCRAAGAGIAVRQAGSGAEIAIADAARAAPPAPARQAGQRRLTCLMTRQVPAPRPPAAALPWGNDPVHRRPGRAGRLPISATRRPAAALPSNATRKPPGRPARQGMGASYPQLRQCRQRTVSAGRGRAGRRPRCGHHGWPGDGRGARRGHGGGPGADAPLYRRQPSRNMMPNGESPGVRAPIRCRRPIRCSTTSAAVGLRHGRRRFRRVRPWQLGSAAAAVAATSGTDAGRQLGCELERKRDKLRVMFRICGAHPEQRDAWFHGP